MSLIFSAVIIISLIYPGIVFRVAYFKGIFTKTDITALLGNKYANKIKFKFLRASMWEQVVASLLPAFFIHALTVTFVEWLYRDIDYALLYKLLSPPSKDTALSLAEQESLGAQFINYTFYMAFAMFLAVAGAALLRFLVYRFNLDTRSNIFKFNNDWYYLLSGRLADTQEFKRSFGECQSPLVQIHALVETKEQSIIYDGFLFEYELTENGDNLDRIVLTSVRRRETIKKQWSHKSSEETHDVVVGRETYNKSDLSTNIDQQLLILPYSQIKNMTVTYVPVSSDQEVEEVAAPAE